MHAQGHSPRLAGRFLHRYEMCQAELAIRVIEGEHPDKQAQLRSYLANDWREVSSASASFSSLPNSAERLVAVRSTPGDAVLHFMTLFLQAYVAARQVSVDRHADLTSDQASTLA
jgi:hypothetical protein